MERFECDSSKIYGYERCRKHSQLLIADVRNETKNEQKKKEKDEEKKEKRETEKTLLPCVYLCASIISNEPIRRRHILKQSIMLMVHRSHHHQQTSSLQKEMGRC